MKSLGIRLNRPHWDSENSDFRRLCSGLSRPSSVTLSLLTITNNNSHLSIVTIPSWTGDCRNCHNWQMSATGTTGPVVPVLGRFPGAILRGTTIILRLWRATSVHFSPCGSWVPRSPKAVARVCSPKEGSWITTNLEYVAAQSPTRRGFLNFRL